MASKIEYKSVRDFNEHFGFETLHPLVSIGRYEGPPEDGGVETYFGIYAVFLKETKGCRMLYGLTEYDFDEMTITAVAPGQKVTSVAVQSDVVPKWTALVFHPEFLLRTSLGNKMSKYGFFGYTSNEALHLSASEVEVVKSVLAIISQEVSHAIDRHSRAIIISNIEVLLGYCQRFYERQFITREEINHAVVGRFEAALHSYLEKDAETKGLPTVAYFADKFSLSPGYFGELVKTETGRTAKDFISDKVLAFACELLSDMSLSVSQVAMKLGFDYPQHFNRFFKRHTGKTPKGFRLSAAG